MSDPRPEIPGWTWQRLAALVVVIVGLGSIGAPLARNLLGLGVRRFRLIDPKRYRDSSVGVQCVAADAGRLKVDVVARKLRHAGADVSAFPEFVEHVEPGWAAEGAAIVACVDRLSGVRASHELASRMRRPLWRVNLEPTCLVSSIRGVDYRRDDLPSCAICGWTEHEIQQQEVIHSCAPDDGRATGSPLALSELTAGWAALEVARGMARPEVPDDIDDRFSNDREQLFTVLGPALRTSEVPANPGCRCRSGPGPIPVALDQGPDSVSLDDLARRAGLDGEPTVSGSGRFGLRGRCRECHAIVALCRWYRDLDRPVARCNCGGDIHLVPFATTPVLRRAAFGARWTDPVSTLGVPERAVIELGAGARRVPFVLIPERTSV